VIVVEPHTADGFGAMQTIPKTPSYCLCGANCRWRRCFSSSLPALCRGRVKA